jgi:DNA-binding transcriptional MerR regulator
MRVDEVTAELTVGQFAARAEVRADTIRYYERQGLLPAPHRTGGEHRRYRPADVDRLLFIRGAQRLGLRLAEIRDLLAVRDTGECPCEPASDLLRRHVTQLEADISRLSALRDELRGMLSAMPGQECPDPLPGTWRPPGYRRTGEEAMTMCECCGSGSCDGSCCDSECC